MTLANGAAASFGQEQTFAMGRLRTILDSKPKEKTALRRAFRLYGAKGYS